MARSPSQTAVFEALLERYGAEIAEGFADAIAEINSQIELQRAVLALQQRNIEAFIEALHIDRAAYGPLLDAIESAYQAGGRRAADQLPRRTPDGAAVIFRFDGRNPMAQRWLARHGAALVTHIIEDQRQAIRYAAVAGLNAGRNPRAVALDIVGRISRATGRREGGIVGLTRAQAAYVVSAREELASGDAALLKNYLRRQARDRRFDSHVLRAIRNEAAVPADVREKMVARYSDRLLKQRGEMIARTEALSALNASQDEALRQAVASGLIREEQVRRVWRSAGDARVRETHRALNGESVGLNEAFTSPTGAMIRFPGDPMAPAEERINCRCWVLPRIDWLANAV